MCCVRIERNCVVCAKIGQKLTLRLFCACGAVLGRSRGPPPKPPGISRTGGRFFGRSGRPPLIPPDLGRTAWRCLGRSGRPPLDRPNAVATLYCFKLLQNSNFRCSAKSGLSISVSGHFLQHKTRGNQVQLQNENNQTKQSKLKENKTSGLPPG